jgi:hypothetical protein
MRGFTKLKSFLTAPRGTVNIDWSALGSRLSGPRRLAWPRTSPFHGGNTGSNPVGDANKIKGLIEMWEAQRRFLQFGPKLSSYVAVALTGRSCTSRGQVANGIPPGLSVPRRNCDCQSGVSSSASVPRGILRWGRRV